MSAKTIALYRDTVRPTGPELSREELFAQVDKLETEAAALEAKPARLRARAADLREVIRKMSEHG